MFKGMTFRLIVSDECHQADLRTFAAVALHTDTLLLLMDEDQAIDFSRSPDKLVQRSSKVAGEYWSWQRALTRVSMVPIWSYQDRVCPVRAKHQHLRRWRHSRRLD